MIHLVTPQTRFLCDSCDQYHPIGEHQACRDLAAGPEFEASGSGSATATANGPSAFRLFWANVVRKPCPECKHLTAVGFDRNDPETREPTRCALCAKAEVDNAIQFARGEIGYPLTEQGPCANAECRAPHHLYGPNGYPLCPECREAAPENKTAPVKEHQVSRKSHQVAIPAQREPGREKEPSLF